MAAAAPLVKLMTSDSEIFEVEASIAHQSITIKNMLDDIEDLGEIPLPNVNSATLKKIIQFCEHHKSDSPDAPRGDIIDDWDEQFCKVDQDEMLALILAANYLDIKSLLDLTCKTVANMIKGKTPEQIRQTFNIKNDFTPEEEDAVRKYNEWVGEDA